MTAPSAADARVVDVPPPFAALGRHGATSDVARRLVIVGDVHGCFDELQELLEAVKLQPEDLLISVGDLVDRGPASLEVVRFFRERPNTLVLMGNHERKHARAVFSYAQEIVRIQLGERYAEIVEWMKTLPYYYEDARVRVVHAAMVPGTPLAAQRLEILAGTTTGERELEMAVPEGRWHERYGRSPDDERPVVFGHQVVGDEAMARGDGKVFGLDTGACHGGRLTALSVPDFTITQVSARADHWAEAKVRWQLPVLQAKPWLTLLWAELNEELARFASGKSEEARRWVGELRAYTEALRARREALHRVANELAARLLEEHGAAGFSAAARQHAASALLFQAHRGRLDLATMEKLCVSPQRVRDFAAQLGVALPAPPAPLS